MKYHHWADFAMLVVEVERQGWRGKGGGGGEAKVEQSRHCRQDISPMCKLPIWTGFDPPDIPHSL